jgi:acyl carrier protein
MYILKINSNMSEVIDILSSIRPEIDFSSSTDFIEDGYLDSLDIVTLVSELDKKYAISIDGMDIVPENFNNVESINILLRKNGVKI